MQRKCIEGIITTKCLNLKPASVGSRLFSMYYVVIIITDSDISKRRRDMFEVPFLDV